MKLDRHLISIALIFLLLQLFWLAHELQFINIPFLKSNDQNQNTWVVGKIVHVHNNVRRRPVSEIVWNEGREQEDVKAFDALLTLKQSTMKIQLANGAELNLSENTLVYLEPMMGDIKDQRIRIRFAHGSLRSKLKLEPTDFQSESWVISPQPGAEFQLKSFEDGRAEIELSKGQMTAEQNGQKISLKEGEFATISEEKLIEKKQILNSLTWKTGHNNYYRKYSHQFPTEVDLDWIGSAKQVVIYQNGKIIEHVEIGQNENKKKIKLGQGSFEMRMENSDGHSNWLVMDIWNAPVIHLMSPLPRDRYQIGENLKYIWLNPQDINSYVWEMRNSQNKNEVNSVQVEERKDLSFAAQSLGKHEWAVIGKDRDGYQIPSPYSNPIYFVEAPLDAPELHQATLEKAKPPKEFERRIRSPSSDKAKTDGQDSGGQNSSGQKKITPVIKNGTQKNRNRKDGAGLKLLHEFWLVKMLLYEEKIFAAGDLIEKTPTKLPAKPKLKIKNQSSLSKEAEKLSTAVVPIEVAVPVETEAQNPVTQQALETGSQKFDSKNNFLKLSWSSVPGAEHYVLEVSENPDFRRLIVENTISETSFNWDAQTLRGKMFYWRVAGGAKNKMGRFSKVQEVNIKQLNSGKHFAGISIVEKKPVAEISSSEFALENNSSEQKNVEMKSLAESKLDEPPDIFEKNHRLVSTSLNLESSTFTDSSSTGFKYAGLTMKFRYSVDANLEGDYRIGGSAAVQSNSWKNVDQDSIMIGKNYYEQKSRFMGWLGKRKSPWAYSLGFGYQDTPARAGLETTRFNSSILLNAGAWYDFSQQYYFRGKLGIILSTGSDLSDVSISYYGHRPLKEFEKFKTYWGPDFELSSIRTTTGTNGIKYQFGVLFGIIW